MTVFVDSSALYATLDAADVSHQEAAAAFRSLRSEELVTHDYVVVEAAALVQPRLGIGVVRDLIESLLRPVRVIWIDGDLHTSAITALLASRRRGVSWSITPASDLSAGLAVLLARRPARVPSPEGAIR